MVKEIVAEGVGGNKREVEVRGISTIETWIYAGIAQLEKQAWVKVESRTWRSIRCHMILNIQRYENHIC